MVATPDAPPTRGHKKKARTRRLLVDATVALLAERGLAFAVTDVVERAGVSNGTFYNYFDDREHLVDEVIPELIGRFTSESALRTSDAEPALRFATISAVLLAWAASNPAAAEAVVRPELLQRPDVDQALFGHLREDLAAGVDAGVFGGVADAATVDVVAGALFIAVSRLARNGPDPAYQHEVLVRLLQSLGVPRRRATSLASRAYRSRTT